MYDGNRRGALQVGVQLVPPCQESTQEASLQALTSRPSETHTSRERERERVQNDRRTKLDAYLNKLVQKDPKNERFILLSHFRARLGDG